MSGEGGALRCSDVPSASASTASQHSARELSPSRLVPPAPCTSGVGPTRDRLRHRSPSPSPCMVNKGMTMIVSRASVRSSCGSGVRWGLALSLILGAANGVRWAAANSCSSLALALEVSNVERVSGTADLTEERSFWCSAEAGIEHRAGGPYLFQAVCDDFAFVELEIEHE